MESDGKHVKKRHPKETSNPLSVLTFFYTLDLFRKGYKKPIDVDDLYKVLSSCESKKVGDSFENAWEIDRKINGKASLIRVISKLYGKSYVIIGVIQLIMRSIFIYFIPEAMGKLIAFFNPNQTAITLQDAYYYAGIVIGFNTINFIYIQHYHIFLTELEIRIRNAICSLVYRKCLRLTSDSLAKITVGKIITLITKDIGIFEKFIEFGNDLWIGVFQVAFVVYLIYQKLGIATFVGIGFFMIILPIQVAIGRLSLSLRLKANQQTDQRLHFTQETLKLIKIVKMYTWERFFSHRIALARKQEMNSVLKLSILYVILGIIGALSTKIAFYLSIMSNTWLGNATTAEMVFFTLTCFGKLHHFLSYILPQGVSTISQLSASMSRIRNVLDAEELPTIQNQIASKDPKISFKNASVSVDNVQLVKESNFELKRGLNIVTGHVGCGKSTLLKTLFGEYKHTGNIEVEGRVSYASQEPWLFSASIKDNILFGEAMQEKRYMQVLEACALIEDLEQLPERDETIVGDRGTNLSKGQQSRVNLARAVYRNSDIYLLDDCLAPLDARVAQHVFQKCIVDFLEDKLIVFVTSEEEQIKEAGRIVRFHDGFLDVCKEFPKYETEEIVDENKMEVKEKEKSVASNPEVEREALKTGKVNISVYNDYVKSGGGYFIFLLILVLYVVAQGILNYSDKLVSKWVTVEQNISNFELNENNYEEYENLQERRSFLLILYSSVIGGAVILFLSKALAFNAFARKASINIHKNMIEGVFNADMKFLDNTRSGNILNRFSKDLNTIDEILPHTFEHSFGIALYVIGTVVLISTVNAIFLIPCAVFFLISFLLCYFYLETARNLQRLYVSTRGPLLGHINTSLDGLSTIRAFQAQTLMKEKFNSCQDTHASADYCLQTTGRAFALVLDAFSILFTTIVIARFLLVPKDTSVGDVGLAVTQTFSMTNIMQFCIRRWATLENEMISVERVLEYCRITKEKKDGTPPGNNWPEIANVSFENVSLTYGTVKTLDNINLSVDNGQSVVITGRTGAGKSSLISALFRLYPIEGTIKIDNINIETVPLVVLRSRLTIIPQDPLLFTGSIRENIDPYYVYRDEEIWRVLATVKMNEIIKNLSENLENVSSLSVGQKQLICLARAILRKNKIIIMDELTANMDAEMDALLCSIINTSFEGCTLISISHKVGPILCANKIVNIKNGKIE